jgi:COP9 signalosome complex subunit 4
MITQAQLRTQLNALTNSSGIHKEQIDKYKNLLDKIQSNPEPELVETLKIFIEASEYFHFCSCN